MLIKALAQTLLTLLALAAPSAFAASLYSAPRYAAILIDNSTGEVLYARRADEIRYPASITKVMTLYVAFQAIEKNEISLDSYVTVSRNAAAEPPSKLWLKRGQKIKLRYLNRQGEQAEMHATGLLATCLQHEIDHLNGVLFIDHISRLKRERVIKKFQKAQKLGKL